MKANVKERIRQYLDNEIDDFSFESNEEYSYAFGQIVKFFMYKTKVKKYVTYVQRFLIAKTGGDAKNKLIKLFTECNRVIDFSETKFNKLFSAVMEYDTDESLDQVGFMAGVTGNCLLLGK